MKIPKSNSPEITTKTATITLKSEINGEVVYSEPIELPSGKTPKRLYNENERLLVYFSDGSLCEYKEREWQRASDTQFTGPPDIKEILYKGEKKLLFITADKSEIEGGIVIENIPKGDYYAKCYGMLFSGKDRILRFSAPFDYTNFDTDLKLGGYFEIETESGKIKGIEQTGENLTLFCTHSIISLSINGDRTDYTAKRVETGYIDIKGGSVTCSGEKAYFITENKFTLYTGNSIKTLCRLPTNINITGQAKIIDNSYILPIQQENKEKLLCIDLESYGATTIEYTGLIGDRYIADNGTLYKINVEKTREYRAETNLSTTAVKSLIEIIISKTKGNTLKITGDFGEKLYNIDKNYTFYRCYLISRVFTFSCDSEIEITIKYYKGAGK